MSIRVMTRVWDSPTKNHTEKLVLLALADNASDEGECYPSLATIAKKCEMSVQGVINRIALLESDGRLVVRRESGKSNHYQMNIPTPEPKTTQRRLVVGQTPHPSTALTTPLNGVDHHPSTALTAPLNGVDPNHKEPSIEPSLNLAAPLAQPLTGKPASGSDSKPCPPAKPEPAPSDGPSFHKQFTEAWCDAYQTERSESYLFVGGRDGSAVKRLNATGMTVGELVALARRAWKARGREFFWCEKAVTIGAFAGRLNEIRAELAAPSRRTLPAAMRVATPAELARDAAEEF